MAGIDKQDIAGTERTDDAIDRQLFDDRLNVFVGKRLNIDSRIRIDARQAAIELAVGNGPSHQPAGKPAADFEHALWLEPSQDRIQHFSIDGAAVVVAKIVTGLAWRAAFPTKVHVDAALG